MTNTCVISSYKYGHLAAHCIETVLAQTKPFDKILFVDDGAYDCDHLPALYPDVEYTFRAENVGVVWNFHDMLQKVDTDRVMFLGADNWIREDTLEKLSKSSADIVTYDIIVVGNLKDEITKRHGDEVKGHHGSYLWDRSKGHHGSMLYNATMAKEVGGYKYKQQGRSLEDMVLYHRLLDNGATREHIAQPLLYYRRHKENYNPC